MYNMLHSERLLSNPMHGYLFVAQLLGGKLTYGAQMQQPLGQYGNTFYLDDYQWDTEHAPYVIDIGPLYLQAFKTEEVQRWVTDVVLPWEREQKLRYIEMALDRNEDDRVALVTESLKLQAQKT